jgi:hypothetical protein
MNEGRPGAGQIASAVEMPTIADFAAIVDNSFIQPDEFAQRVP